jgi:hypothetical protein
VVVERQVDLGLLASGQIEEVLVKSPALGVKYFGFADAGLILRARRRQREELADGVLVAVRVGTKRDELSRGRRQPVLVCIAILDDETGDPLRVENINKSVLFDLGNGIKIQST